MADLSVTLFGTTEIEIDKRPLRKFRATKVQALLIYLLVQGKQIHQREALMALLWPDAPLKSAQGSLRQTIHRLRQDIPESASNNGQGRAPLILTDRQTVQINPDATYTLDVIIFKELLISVQTHPHESVTDCVECHARLKQAITLYQGDFLADFYIPESNPFEEGQWSNGKPYAAKF